MSIDTEALQTSLCGPGGGPSFTYRGAVIDADPAGLTFAVTLAGMPGSPTRGVYTLLLATMMVDQWLDYGWLLLA